MDKHSSQAVKPEDFPALFAPTVWFGHSDVQFELCAAPPERPLISNINIVPYSGEHWLILRLANSPEIPGGTSEPDEHYETTLQRELLEEAGAKLLNYQPVGAFRCYSHAEKPYRPHLPFPLAYRFVVMGEVEIIGQPTNPPDGEQILAVELVALATAVAVFQSAGRYDIADLYRLAAQLRQQAEK